MIVSFRPGKYDLSTTRQMERDRLEQWPVRYRRTARQFSWSTKTFQHRFQFYFINLLAVARYNVQKSLSKREQM